MKYKSKCPECGNEILFTEHDKFVKCPECDFKQKNPKYEEESFIDKEFEQLSNDKKIIYVVKEKEPQDVGSFGLGFCLSFFFGIIGLIIGLFGKEKTRKGAGIGFLINIIIAFLLVILYACIGVYASS